MNIQQYEYTLCVNGVHLTSSRNREGEAITVASMIPADATEAWVYGPALGDAVRVLLSRPGMERVYAVIMNREISEACRAYWPDDPRVTVLHASDLDRIMAPFCCSPVELRLADADAWHIRDRVYLVLNEPFNRFIFNTMEQTWAKQREENKPFLDVDQHVSHLFGTTPGVPAIVIGGGPTLDQHYEWIKGRKGNTTIAASSALGPLVLAGIMPDIVVVIDRDRRMARHFDGIEFTGTLVYLPEIAPHVVSSVKGRRYTVGGRDLYGGGSVLHNQIDLAVLMGAPEVFLVGADFCYPNGKSHAHTSALAYDLEHFGKLSTMNGLGELVPTDENLAQYRCYVEDYVANHPEVKFWKIGRAGAETKGVDWFDADRTA